MSSLPSLPDQRHSFAPARTRALRHAHVSALLALSLLTTACDEKVKLEKHQTNESTSLARPDQADESDASTEPMRPSCEGLDDGELCTSDRHCIAGQCVFNTCGDGVRAGDEECDDGNESLGDDCNPACKFTPVSCGNAKMETGEECDDGNQNDEDACSRGCTLNVCGNGRRDAKEECDDGNQDNEDYCKNDCQRSLCRNGRLDPGEECDDGNATHTDGCSNDCRAIGCGDGKLYTMAGLLFEECDDGNKVDADGCSNKCTVNRCGNERVDPGELCDGNTSDQGKCNADCKSWGMDRCVECMKSRCNPYDFGGSGISSHLYDVCYEQALPEKLAVPDLQPGPNWIAQCTAFDRCVRENDCFDPVSSSTWPCICGKLTLPACQALGSTLPEGPCVAPAVVATNCEEDAQKATCLLGQMQDLTRPAGQSYFLAECRHVFCSAECKDG